MKRDLLTIASYPTVVEAEMVRTLMEGAGIAAVLADTHLATTDPFAVQALGMVSLQVERKDLEDAMAFLRDHEEEIHEARDRSAAEEDDGIERCLSCRAPFPEEEDRCPACGFTYDRG